MCCLVDYNQPRHPGRVPSALAETVATPPEEGIMISQATIDAQVQALLDAVPDGEDLDDLQVILLNYALRVCGSALDVEGASEWQRRALDAGVTTDELHEIVTLMSAIGVHTFF